MERGLVDEEAVDALAVLAQALAVVGRHHQERVVPQPQAAQGLVQAAHELVRPRDLAVVGPARVSAGVGLGRLVGIVRVVEVDPREERARPAFPPATRWRTPW